MQTWSEPFKVYVVSFAGSVPSVSEEILVLNGSCESIMCDITNIPCTPSTKIITSAYCIMAAFSVAVACLSFGEGDSRVQQRQTVWSGGEQQRKPDLPNYVIKSSACRHWAVPSLTVVVRHRSDIRDPRCCTLYKRHGCG